MRTTTIPTEIKAASKREQSQARLSSAERELARAMLKVLMNHIYELQKGVRQMVLFTCDKRYGDQTVERLESQGIPYVLQPAGQKNLNVYFGRRECLEAIRLIVTRPLNQLTPRRILSLGRCWATTYAPNASATASVRMAVREIATASVSRKISHIN